MATDSPDGLGYRVIVVVVAIGRHGFGMSIIGTTVNLAMVKQSKCLSLKPAMTSPNWSSQLD
jgi:hypothetical protein